MPKIPEIAPVGDLRQETAAVLERIRKSAQPGVITHVVVPLAVMVSTESYERSEHERSIRNSSRVGD